METTKFKNREISWLEFNRRVLNQATLETNTTLEKMKFLSITSSNLDEFFMVRVGSLTDLVNAKYEEKDISGLTPRKQLDLIHKTAHDFYKKQYETYYNILGELEDSGVHFIKSHKDLNATQKEFVDNYFKKNIYPLITPLAVDSSRPFPLVKSNSINIGAILINPRGSVAKNKSKDKNHKFEFSTIEIPSSLPRVIPIPDKEKDVFILIEEVVKRNMKQLFNSYDVKYSCCYKVTRNADLNFHEEEAADLLKEIKKQLKYRKWGEVVRIEVESNIDGRVLKILKKNLKIKKSPIYCCTGPIDLKFCMEFLNKDLYKHAKLTSSEKLIPKLRSIFTKQSMFDIISEKDILLQHPFDAYLPVVKFIQEAAVDKNVLAIKQTLYRVSSDSPIVKALILAAENGKSVTVLVEVKARFDEENNIEWAERLEKAGAHVIYGLAGLKVHAKLALVIRKENDQLKRYVHLGTGNYNDITSKIYVDYSFFTANDSYGEDATSIFNMLSGYSKPKNLNKLYISPINIRKRLTELIDNEINSVKNGKHGYIRIVVNSLSDKKMIEKLYEAGESGVKVDLIVRGICCMTNITEDSNINIYSYVGKYLEHSRVYIFENGGKSLYYLSSADLMERNLDNRVEVLFPVPEELFRSKYLVANENQTIYKLINTEYKRVVLKNKN